MTHPAQRRIAAARQLEGELDRTVAPAHSLRLELALVAQADRNAVMLWLLSAQCSAFSRRRMAASMMARSVYLQAYMLGLVACHGCGDQGCELCIRPAGRRIP